MFIESLVSRAKDKLWRYFLPRFTLKNHVDDRVYNYYGIYFSDVKQEKYQLVSLSGKNVVLEKWHAEQHAYVEKINLPLNDLEKMNVEIIHWRKQGPLRFDSIFLFTISYFTRIAYVKNMLARAKSRVFSTFSSTRELTGLDRIMLLQVLVNEYVHQSPQKTHTGVTCEEVIDLLYGTLWYKHIKNEDFRRKVFCYYNLLSLQRRLNLTMKNIIFRVRLFQQLFHGNLKINGKSSRSGSREILVV